jgi:hypothetical protein
MFGIPALSAKYIALAIASVIGVVVVLRISLRKLGRRMPESALTWRSYLKGQGTILFGFLFLGAALSCLSWALSYYGLGRGKVSEGGQLIEFRQLNPSEHPIYEEIDARNYSKVTVITKVVTPENGSANVTVYADQDGETKGLLKRIASAGATWSLWEHENSSKHLSLIVESGVRPVAGSTLQVDVLVYLSPK